MLKNIRITYYFFILLIIFFVSNIIFASNYLTKKFHNETSINRINTKHPIHDITKENIKSNSINRSKILLSELSDEEIYYLVSNVTMFIKENNINDFINVINHYDILHYRFLDGSTWLHLATNHNRLLFVRYLLINGLDDHLVNNNNISSYDLAFTNGYIDIISLMINTRHNNIRYF